MSYPLRLNLTTATLLLLSTTPACPPPVAPCACPAVVATLVAGDEEQVLGRLEQVRLGDPAVVPGCDLDAWWSACGPSVLPALRQDAVGSAPRVTFCRAAAARGSSSLAPTLVSLLGDPAPAVRREAVWALAPLSPELLRPHVPELLRDPDPEVRAAAAHAATTLRVEGVDEALVAGLLAASDSTRRGAFERALVALGAGATLRAELLRQGPAAPVVLMSLLAELDDAQGILIGLRHPAPALRQVAAGAAGRLRLSAALPALTELLDSTDAALRRRAEDSLARIADPSSAPTFVAWLSGSDSHRARAACLALGALPADPAGPPALLAALDHSEPTVRLAAAAALTRVGGDPALLALEALASKEPDPTRRRRYDELHRRLFRRLRRERRAREAAAEPPAAQQSAP